MFRFENPDFLYVLFVIPLLIIVFILKQRDRKKSLKKFGEISVISQLMPDISYNRPVIRFIYIIITLSILIISVARPQLGTKVEEVKREGIEIVIALDVSNSMLSEDIVPNRLEKAKREISRMLNKLKEDKIGLIVFAGESYTLVPITTDYSATKLFLSSINTDFIQKQGTAIGSAIDLASKSFSPKNDKGKVIIIITDGENHEDNPILAAQKAKEKGIIIYTIGMGKSEGAPIPINNSSSFRKNKEGNVIISKLDETSLSKIASEGGGKFIRASNSRSSLSELYNDINSMEKSKLESKVYSGYNDRFQYFLVVALIFIILEFTTLERKNRWFRKLNLFN